MWKRWPHELVQESAPDESGNRQLTRSKHGIDDSLNWCSTGSKDSLRRYAQPHEEARRREKESRMRSRLGSGKQRWQDHPVEPQLSELEVPVRPYYYQGVPEDQLADDSERPSEAEVAPVSGASSNSEILSVESKGVLDRVSGPMPRWGNLEIPDEDWKTVKYPSGHAKSELSPWDHKWIDKDCSVSLPVWPSVPEVAPEQLRTARAKSPSLIPFAVRKEEAQLLPSNLLVDERPLTTEVAPSRDYSKCIEGRNERYMLRPHLFHEVVSRLTAPLFPTLEAFADSELHLLPRWWGPGSLECEDAFSQDWGGGPLIWANPPFSKLLAVVKKSDK